MKILLLGDMSAYHANLAAGLRSLGLYVDLASGGDGFKGFNRDIDLASLSRWRFIQKSIRYYDVIQVLGLRSLGVKGLLYLFLMKRMGRVSSKVYLSTVGSDYVFWTLGRKNLEMPLFDEVEKIDSSCSRKDAVKHRIASALLLSSVEGTIGCFEYHEAYKAFKRCMPPVPQPINISELSYKEMDFSGKLLVYHGINPGREGFKGSYHIMKAFKVLNQRYPNDINCIAKGGLPYSEYMKLVEGCHILIDQTNFIAHGMNALNGMALGKVVACGSQKDFYWDRWKTLLGIDKKPPLIPLEPDSDQIISQIEWLLHHRERLPSIAREGRAYVERYHDSRKVARLFLSRWGIV